MKYWPEFILFTGLFLVLFLNLSGPKIERWDEYTNIQVVKGSISPFFEKPPLWYFLTSIFYKVLGDGIFVFRLVSAISGFLLAVGGYFFSRKFFDRGTGIWYLVAFLTTGQMFFKSSHFFSTHTLRSADLDALQLVLIFFSFYSLGYFLENSQKKTKWLCLSAVFAGLAYLTKGPFAFLPLIIFTAYLIINRQIRSQWKYIVIYVATVAAVVLPWHIYMIIKYEQEFIGEYLKYHILQRTFTQLEGHNHSAIYYLKIWIDPRMFAGFWILLLALPKLTLKKEWWKQWKYFQILFGFYMTSFLLIIIQTRLAWYLLYLHLFSFLVIALFLQSSKHTRIY